MKILHSIPQNIVNVESEPDESIEYIYRGLLDYIKQEKGTKLRFGQIYFWWHSKRGLRSMSAIWKGLSANELLYTTVKEVVTQERLKKSKI